MSGGAWCKPAVVAGISFISSVVTGHAETGHAETGHAALVEHHVTGESDVTVAPPQSPEGSEVYWRWIGKKCLSNLPPSLSDWTVRSLVPAESPCEALKEFCVYTKTSDPVTPAEIAALERLGAQPDVAALAPAGNLDPAEAQLLEAAFLEQIGKPALLPQRGGGAAPGARLAIFDTSPANATGAQRSHHGKSLVAHARNLLCNDPENFADPDCKAEIQPRLALPYFSIDPEDYDNSHADYVHGGYVGLIGELAEALSKELERQSVTGNRLVLNLSLGWDRMYGGGEPEVTLMPLAVQAVYHALEYAACQGSVNIAAAGNFSDAHADNNIDEPLFPAAWTDRPALCPGVAEVVPMIYAAGGVDARRKALANSLAAGMPEFAVYSDHVVFRDVGPMTGSSLSAAVLSVTAAAVLHYAPDLPATDVLGVIHQSGEPLDTVSADFCHAAWESCPFVSYVSLCESIAAACSESPGCSSPPDCPVRPDDLLDFSGISSGPFDVTIDLDDLTSYDENLFIGGETCATDLPVEASVVQVPTDPCPRRQYHARSRSPGSHPQPAAEKCPNCKYGTTSDEESLTYGFSFRASSSVNTLDIEIANLSEDEHADSLTLDLSSCGDGPSFYQVWQETPGAPMLVNGRTIQVVGVRDCDSVALTYTIHDETHAVLGSQTSSFLVVEK